MIKQLRKEKQALEAKIDMETLINDANTLLLNAHKEEDAILDSLHMSQNDNSYEKKLIAEVKRTKDVQEIYNKESFTGRQIRSLCREYDLKMLLVANYTGPIPTEFTKIIAKFALEQELSKSDMRDSFFILAPVELFNTVKKVYPAPPDPILFYRDPEKMVSSYETKAQKDEVFVQLLNWGNDFQLSRRFRFLTNTHGKKETMSNLSVTVLASIVLFLAFLALQIHMALFMSVLIISYGITLLTTISDNYKRYTKFWNTSET